MKKGHQGRMPFGGGHGGNNKMVRVNFEQINLRWPQVYTMPYLRASGTAKFLTEDVPKRCHIKLNCVQAAQCQPERSSSPTDVSAFLFWTWSPTDFGVSCLTNMYHVHVTDWAWGYTKQTKNPKHNWFLPPGALSLEDWEVSVVGCNTVKKERLFEDLNNGGIWVTE